MTPQSLFNIIIKIFGFFFLRDIVNMLPQLFSSFVYFTSTDTVEEGIWTLILLILLLAFYAFLTFCLLFKTDYFLNKLKLGKDFNQEVFSFNIATSTVLTIALIIIGGVVLVNEIPNLCALLFAYFQERHMTHNITKADFTFSIISAVKIIIALLIIGERNRIIDFVEKRQSRKQPDQSK